jgi:hypothetical protein
MRIPFLKQTPAPTPEVVAQPADPFNDPANERCSNPRCPKFISEKHTPKAVVYCGKTFCEESCVPPSVRTDHYTRLSEEKASRENSAQAAIELAKANRITRLRNQIANVNAFLESFPDSGVAIAQLTEFETALAEELEVPDMSPHLVIKPPKHQHVLHSGGRGYTSHTS